MWALAIASMSALHGAPPVPHWAVLLTVVPALWLLVGSAVALLDRLLDWMR